MVSLYGPPNEILFQASSETLHVLTHLKDTSIAVVPLTQLLSVVGMVPWKQEVDQFYVAEKMSLDVQFLTEAISNDEEEDSEDGEDVDSNSD